MYRNRFQHDAARSAPRNVSTNIRLTPSTLPAMATQMDKIAVLKDTQAAAELCAEIREQIEH